MSIKPFCSQSHSGNERRDRLHQTKATDAVASMNIEGMTLASSAEKRAGGPKIASLKG